MPFSVRLDPPTDTRIRRLARRTGRTRSQVVREAIALYDAREQEPPGKRPTFYERIQHVVGRAHSGDGRLSEHTGDRFTAVVQQKARARRTR